MQLERPEQGKVGTQHRFIHPQVGAQASPHCHHAGDWLAQSQVCTSSRATHPRWRARGQSPGPLARRTGWRQCLGGQARRQGRVCHLRLPCLASKKALLPPLLLVHACWCLPDSWAIDRLKQTERPHHASR